MSQYLVLIYQDERALEEPTANAPMMQAHQDFMEKTGRRWPGATRSSAATPGPASGPTAPAGSS